MSQSRALRLVFGALLVAAAALSVSKPASAHPHVFIDGGVDFLMDEQGALHGLSITWRYDAFETLYVLTSIGIIPAPDGTLSPEDRETLIRKESNWPEDFHGASHLSIDGSRVQLSGPKALDATLKDGRLVVRFRRDLEAPASMRNQQAEVAFFERTYYYAFSVAASPKIVGTDQECRVDVNPFVAVENDQVTQAALAKLGREETPEDTNVGALFADRIVLKCAS